jgi:four helix bundle protein
MEENGTDGQRPDWIERAHWFAVAVLRLVNELPNSIAGRAMGHQIAKSGPSVVHNMEEAKGASTVADTYHKTVIARKEARECRRSLLIVRDAGLLTAKRCEWEIQEASEFVAMLTAGAKRLELQIPENHRSQRRKQRPR